jgi:hypothetical protein
MAKGKMQDNQDKETSTDEVQTEYNTKKKFPVGPTASEIHPSSSTVGTEFLSQD